MRTWIEINKDNIRHNYETFRGLVGSDRQVAAVVKSNAYGHNLRDFSLVAQDLGIDWFAVDSMVEGETLRKAGVRKPILVLGYTIKEDLESAIDHDIAITVADFFTLESLKDINRKGKIRIHLKIDTGMHRQGFFPSEIPEVIKRIKELRSNVILEGVYTHFAKAKDPSSLEETFRQLDKFKKVIKTIEEEGFTNILKHAAATSATIALPQSHFDMVRVGIGMYGLWPSEELKSSFRDKISLKPVLSWKTIIGQTKNLPANSGIGYEFTEVVQRSSRIAILPVGYWHGLPFSLSGKAEVLIRGKRAKILGRICMDMTMVDITNIKEAEVGDEVTIIGEEEGVKIGPEDLSFLAGTSTYEITTCLNPRIKRILV